MTIPSNWKKEEMCFDNGKQSCGQLPHEWLVDITPHQDDDPALARNKAYPECLRGCRGGGLQGLIVHERECKCIGIQESMNVT